MARLHSLSRSCCWIPSCQSRCIIDLWVIASFMARLHSNEEEQQKTNDSVEEMAMGDFSEPQNPLDDEFDQMLMV